MKSALGIGLLLLCVTACVSSRTRTESFMALHGQIAQKFSGRYNCGPITKVTGAGDHFFEIAPTNSGCRVIVSEEEFFTQKEWDRRYIAGTNLLTEFMTMASTNAEINMRTARRIGKMDCLLDLPGWSYRNIGVDVRIECPEVVYPGLEKDSTEAQYVRDEVVGLLKPYR